MREIVRERYGQAARTLPDTDDGAPPTLGLGDPVVVAALRPGETVLDLGSGPGRDLFEASRQVGPTGRAIGVDMTPEMIDRARAGAAERGLANVSILDGDLERLPVHCGAIDVVISNCVINLVGDKRRALVEAYRALRPGGRLAILDTAFETEPPADVRTNGDAWSCCVGGALVVDDYAALLRDIGYEDVKVEVQDASCGEACSVDDITTVSVAVTATKPGAAPDAKVSLRPAVASDRASIEALVGGAGLPLDGLRTEDAIVALDGAEVVGVVALERFGPATMLRSLAVRPDRQLDGIGTRLVIAALEVARWAGGEEVYLLTQGAQRFFERTGFASVAVERLRRATPDSAIANSEACSCAAAMRLSFEEADLPLLSRPSTKPLPVFQGGSCC